MLRKLMFGTAIALMPTLAHAQSTYVQPFGNGWIANTPGQPATTIQPFGGGYIENTPGQMPTTIQQFGNGYTINTPPPMPKMPCYMPMGCNN